MFNFGVMFLILFLVVKGYFLVKSARLKKTEPEGSEQAYSDSLNWVTFVLLGAAVLLMYLGSD